MRQLSPPDDILFRLTRLLLATPEDALIGPPISRRTLTAIVTELRRLRARVAELEAQQIAASRPAAADHQ